MEPGADTSFLAAVCRAAHNAGVTTIATRVEDKRQVELLSSLHIDGYQGSFTLHFHWHKRYNSIERGPIKGPFYICLEYVHHFYATYR